MKKDEHKRKTPTKHKHIIVVDYNEERNEYISYCKSCGLILCIKPLSSSIKNNVTKLNNDKFRRIK